MRWLKRLVLIALLVPLAGLAAFVGSSLFSLDWDRQHTAETSRLPLLRSPDDFTDADGLVQIEANGMTFRARVAGMRNDGAGIILLHGFPETSAMWSSLIQSASGQGLRVVAFDQRGYSPGARPEGIRPYLVPELVGDVVAIADAAGFERFHLVGHDWGCVVGWGVAIQHPARVLSWSGLSIPHPATLLAALSEELPPYIKIFTAPFVPETLLSFNGLANLREGSYEDATVLQREDYLAAFSEPGALTGALNWYRAITTSLGDGEALAGPVVVPTLFLWGTQEPWVTDERLEQQRALVTGPYDELELEAGHFLMHDKPELVVHSVLTHVRSVE